MIDRYPLKLCWPVQVPPVADAPHAETLRPPAPLISSHRRSGHDVHPDDLAPRGNFASVKALSYLSPRRFFAALQSRSALVLLMTRSGPVAGWRHPPRTPRNEGRNGSEWGNEQRVGSAHPAGFGLQMKKGYARYLAHPYRPNYRYLFLSLYLFLALTHTSVTAKHFKRARDTYR